MKRDLNLISKILIAVQNGIRLDVPSRFAFNSSSEEQHRQEIVEFDQLKKSNSLSEYTNDQIKEHISLLEEYDVFKGYFFERRLSAFGYRFLSLLQNNDLLAKLKDKIGSSFDLYTPQTLVSLAQQIDLAEKGLRAEGESRLPAKDDILQLEEVIAHAKDMNKKLAASTNNAEGAAQQIEEMKKELEQKIKQAELVLYP